MAKYEVYVLGYNRPFIYESDAAFRMHVDTGYQDKPKAITVHEGGVEIYTTAFTIRKEK